MRVRLRGPHDRPMGGAPPLLGVLPVLLGIVLLIPYAGALGAGAHAVALLPGSVGIPRGALGPAPGGAPRVASGGGAPTWINLCSSCAPTARAYGSMTWDVGDNYAVLFGGENGGTSPDGDTWTYSVSGGWSQVCSSCSPAGRAEPAMSYDSADSRVVMFGGCTGISLSGYCNMGDSWTYAQGTWTQVTGTLPTGVLAGMMSDDPADGEALLFGGCTSFQVNILNPSSSACTSSGYSQQTAVFTAAGGWQVLSPSTVPSVREAEGLAYDPAMKEVIMFGGWNGVNALDDTWAFKGGNWFQLNPVTSPPATDNGVMFWDSATQTIVLTQGIAPAGDLGSTWSFSGGNWTQLFPVTNPTPRDGTMAAAPPNGGLPIIYGGSTNSSNVQDTWALGTVLTASASATPTTTDVGQVVTFSSAASGGQTPYTVSWTFGDGATASTPNASHTYTIPNAAYTATLKVVDAYSQTISQSISLDISALPTVAAAAAPAIVGTGNLTTFWANATGGTAPLTYAWDFGDGCTSPCSTSSNPTHIYANPGNYTAHVTVLDGVQISTTASVTVEVKAPKGAVVASFTASPTHGTAPLPVTFTSTVYGGAPPYTLSWNFGDGSAPATTPTATHTFVTGGTFAVNLTATDSKGHSGSYILSLVVNASPLALSVQATPTGGDAPLAVTLNETLQGGMAPFTYSWNFGDGSPLSTNATAQHTYGAGNWTATFTVVDNPTDGQRTNASVAIQVWPSLTVGNPHIPASPQVGSSGSYSVTVSGGEPPYAIAWDFGDGSPVVDTGSTANATHAFSATGSYTVTVWVTDVNGANASSHQSVVLASSGGGLPSPTGGAGGGFVLFGDPYAVAFIALPAITLAMLAAAVYIGVEHEHRRGGRPPRPSRLRAQLYSEPTYYPGNGWR